MLLRRQNFERGNSLRRRRDDERKRYCGNLGKGKT